MNLKSWFGISATEADFEALYRAELPRIYNFFRYRVGDGQSAEDLTAETFEKAWRNRARYRQDLGAFSTWLFTIARRVAIDYYRKQHTDRSLDETLHLAAESNTEDAAQQQLEFAMLLRLLLQLEERERELVALKYGAGLTNRDIARLTRLSESNVGVILHRTVRSLRQEWETYP